MEPTARGRVFKIPSQPSTLRRATQARTLRQEFQAAFAASDLADFDIFLDSDIVSEQQSHHYNLSPPQTSHSLPQNTTNSTPATLNSTANTTMAAPVIAMPSRGDRSAPQFDTKHLRELRRYFSDLEYCFGRAQITDEAEKKKHACRFVDVDTSELWESLAEFADITKTYDEFCKAIHALYPGSEEERKWSVADMDKLVGERSRLGILSLGDLGEYHRQFLAITTFLIGKTRLSTTEQSRAFARGFQAELWARISQRLQLKLPDHFPDDPYPLNAILEAAQYVLQGTTSTLFVASTNSTTPTTSQTSAVKAEIKTEDLTAILEHLTETFIKALSSQQQNNCATTSD